ncbi:leucine-rich repeat domain-containing protein [Microscilla marina]|uniref:Leucine-rich repeat containing protein n=1 Tax=Microscilla marina ATCC 23134 TaxID=313606 RepID=A1ZCQ0_MICM2|nr:hypothetical protein [Microscilla marina]EAY32052.1 leucine-rich repeat containing protein [Microscilla marina ATCC 23134]
MEIYHPNRGGVYYKEVKSLLEKVKVAEVEELEVNNSHFPRELLQFTQLRRLRLFNLHKFPSEIAAFEHLEELHILGGYSFNSVTPPFSIDLPHLKHLCLSNKYYQSLESDGFAGLPNLEYLCMNELYLGFFPEKVLLLKQLKHLQLNACSFDKLPDDIDRLSQLVTLSLEHNGLKKLPETLGNLTHLKTLLINDNKIKELPSGVTRLLQLTHIEAGRNRLSKLPSEIGELQKLETLTLPKNKLTTLPSSLPNCKKLTLLNLENNQLTELPNAIGNLKQLQTLQVRNNQLETLPQSLGKLRLLTTFDISDNPLLWQTLPYEAKGFRELMLRFVYERISLKATAALSDQLQYFAPDLANHPLQPDAVLSITGRTSLKIKTLKPALEKQGIRYQKKIDQHITHLVIGRLPKLNLNELLKHPVTFLSEAQLNQFLQEQAPPDPSKYLLTQNEHTPEAVKNLKGLLLSEDSSNVVLAVELINSGGFPMALHTELFMAYKMVNDTKVRKQIKPVLEKYSSEKAKEAMRQRMSLYSEHIGEIRLRRNINKYTKDNEFDGAKIARYFWERYRKGILYLFSYGSSEQIQEVLPKGDTLDLSELKINVLPQELAQCTQLKHVILNDCEFANFPKVLLQLSGLETLALQKNYFWKLPLELGQLTQLKKLDLSHNFFDSFPEVVYQLPALKSLSFKTWHTPVITAEVLQMIKEKLPNCVVES